MPMANLTAEVKGKITAAVASGELAPGTVLRQEHIAERFGVSRTPAREALVQLAAAGVVSQRSGRGFEVCPLDDTTVADVQQVRFSLEALALRSLTGQLTPRARLELSHRLDQAELALDDPAEFFELSRRFHIELVDACANSYLRSVLTSVWDHPVQQRIGARAGADRAQRQATLATHRELLAALADGDGAAAEAALMRCHTD